MTLSVIGDVHGKFDEYNAITKQCEYSIQLGDMGWHYEKIKVDIEKHLFFGGNHENYHTYHKYGIGEYGNVNHGGVDFFYVRGAFSIDFQYQRQTNSWFECEELSYAQGMDCIRHYTASRPNIVITHTCPSSISKLVGSPLILHRFGFDPDTFTTHTGRLLQAMLESWRPELWIFGHFHKSWSKTVGGTKFICLNELEKVEL